MKKIFLIIYIVTFSCGFANDGSFYAEGNHLIPINETDISVKKEILTLKKVRNQFIEVTVYYEFFNPKEAKNITVGFEATSPYGDVDGYPKSGQHPYIRDFTVELNNSILKYNIAYVVDSNYVKNGKVNSISLREFKKELENYNDNLKYVYYFKAYFKKGLNVIKHTYNYKLSTSAECSYDISYVLTAANRWANKQIDDFTLIYNSEDFETFYINKTFFEKKNEWIINGIGNCSESESNFESGIYSDAIKFNIQKGNIVFQKKNINFSGNFFLFSINYSANISMTYLPFSIYFDEYFEEPQNDFQRKVYKNLPFARRGYIFQNQELNAFFKKMDWYIPNPNYSPNIDLLSENEKKWIDKWK